MGSAGTSSRLSASLRDRGQRAPAGVSGFRGAQLLRRETNGTVTFTSVTWFTGMDAVREFAGDDYELAVIEDAARAALSGWDEHVSHHEVALQV